MYVNGVFIEGPLTYYNDMKEKSVENSFFHGFLVY